MGIFSIVSIVIAGYLIGSINFAVLVARSHGVDILKFGSGNPGATNITRALGAKWGKIVFALGGLNGIWLEYPLKVQEVQCISSVVLQNGLPCCPQ